jgi:hypothetical protein
MFVQPLTRIMASSSLETVRADGRAAGGSLTGFTPLFTGLLIISWGRFF